MTTNITCFPSNIIDLQYTHPPNIPYPSPCTNYLRWHPNERPMIPQESSDGRSPKVSTFEAALSPCPRPSMSAHAPHLHCGRLTICHFKPSPCPQTCLVVLYPPTTFVSLVWLCLAAITELHLVLTFTSLNVFPHRLSRRTGENHGQVRKRSETSRL